jgi:uncharacterized protein (DUF39 family)
MHVDASVRPESRELQVTTRFQRRLQKIVMTAIVAIVGIAAVEYYLKMVALWGVK